MEQGNWIAASKSFDHAAEYYDTFRPSYPSELMDCLETEASLYAESKILEIGAGSGKASELLLNRGYELMCIEPGQQLAKRGMHKHKGKKIQYAISRFETWDGRPNEYDLIFSAQAFHWVPQPEGYRRCAELLRPGGHLALVWNMYLSGEKEREIEIETLCDTYHIYTSETPEENEQRIGKVAGEISESGYFNAPSIHLFPWSQVENAEQFIGFLRTASGFLVLPEEEQKQFIARIEPLIAANGGVMKRNYVSGLFLAEPK